MVYETNPEPPRILARLGQYLKPVRHSLVRNAAPLALALAATAPAVAQEDVRVYAAASLATAVTALADAYADAGLGEVTLVTGSSGALANQIAQGAPADVYLSANREWVDFLVENRAVAAEAVISFAGNRLVVIVPPGAERDTGDGGAEALAAALDGLRIAVGDPAVAPVGAYARQALTTLGLWQALEPNLVPAQDTSAALAYVTRDAVDAGIVYATDAALTDVHVVATLPEDSHDPIRYYAAPVAGGDPAAAAAFLDMLIGDAGAEVLGGLGFSPGAGDGDLTQ